MPHDKESSAETKCESCDETITSEVYATMDYDILCSDCYSNQCECAHCSESLNEEDATFWRSDPYCQNCADEYLRNCGNCSTTVNTRRQTYYYWENDGETYCESCAGEIDAYSCDCCGDYVYIAEAIDNEGEDYIYGGELCYSCYESKGNKVHLDDIASWKIQKCVFDDAYMKIFDNVAAATWLGQFYGYRLEDFAHQPLLLQKGGVEKNKFGFWKGSIAIDSEINHKVARWIERIISNDNIKCSHKKYGEIRPFCDLLQYYLRFEFKDDNGEYTTRFEEYPYDKPNAYMSMERQRELRHDISNNKLRVLQGKDNYKYINFKRAFNKLLKRYTPLMTASWEGDTIFRWQSDWNKYLTNSVKIDLPVKIGFDPKIMKPLERFNGISNACQNKRYLETLAHSFVDMLVNPHLLLLIYDEAGEEIIGRSVIRTFYASAKNVIEPVAGGVLDSTPFVAPSRLYLSKHSNVKNDICARLYDVLQQWADDYYGTYNLICYDISRHDQSMREYIRNDEHIEFGGRNSHGRLQTELWLPFFLERPRDDSYFLYYPDEQQDIRACKAEQDEKAINHFGYGVAEVSCSYRIVSPRGD
jgi:hypothetical protein